MTISIVLQFVVVLAAIWMGARYSRRGPRPVGRRRPAGAGGRVRRQPTSPPIDVMLIILAVIMAASVMDAAGGIDFLVRIAERIIRANPKYVTIVAPLTTWTLHVPRRYRPHRLSAVAGDLRDRAPERHPAGAADGHRDDRLAAGDHREPGRCGHGGDDRPVRGKGDHAMGPAADPDDLRAGDALRRRRRRRSSRCSSARTRGRSRVPGAAEGRRDPAAEDGRRAAAARAGRQGSAFMFLAGVALVVVFGFFPALRTLPGPKSALAMPVVIEIVMMSVAALMLLVTKVDVDDDPEDGDAARRRGGGDRHLRPGMARRQLHRGEQGRDRAGDRRRRTPRRGRSRSGCSSRRCCSTARPRRRAR